MKSILATVIALVIASSAQASFFKKDVTLGTEDRPATLKLPRFYKENNQVPLVVLLHGRGNNASLTDLYLGLSRSQDKLGYALLLPNGTIRPSDSQRIWNATEECCADNVNDVDDSTYLQGLVNEALNNYNIDPTQVFLFGHSNGGFMSYRLACDTNGLFKGLVSVAGSTFTSEQSCRTNTPINVLQIHGTKDTVVPFDAKGKKYPAAPDTVKLWAERNECQDYTETLASKNLLFLTIEPGLDDNGSPKINGSLFDLSFKPETDELLYSECSEETKVGLWRVNGADHAPLFLGRDVIRQALEFVGYQK